MRDPLIRLVFIIGMAIFGTLIIADFWRTEQFSAIKQVSVPIMQFSMVYIGLHFMKRLLFPEVKWWNWLYYIALVSIILPVLFANSSNENRYHWLVDIGTTFFLIPLIFEINDWRLSLKKKK